MFYCFLLYVLFSWRACNSMIWIPKPGAAANRGAESTLDVVQEKCKVSFPKMKVFCLCFLHLRWCKGTPSASPHTAPGLSSGGCGHADSGTEENTMILQTALGEYLTLSTTGLHRDSPIPALPLFLKVLRTQCPLHQQLDLPTTYLQLQPAHSQMA